MIIIVYLSIALVAIAFFILVVYLSKTLKTLQGTLERASKTLADLEQQLDGVTKETTILLHKTNKLTDDIQDKAESLNYVFDSVKDVGNTIQTFNGSIQSMKDYIDHQFDENKDKVSQVVQWGNVLLEVKEKWQEKRRRKKEELPLNEEVTRKERARQ